MAKKPTLKKALTTAAANAASRRSRCEVCNAPPRFRKELEESLRIWESGECLDVALDDLGVLLNKRLRTGVTKPSLRRHMRVCEHDRWESIRDQKKEHRRRTGRDPRTSRD